MNYIKICTILLVSLLYINNTFAEKVNLSIIDLDSSNSNLLEIFLDKNIESNSMEVEWDIKLFKDLKSNSIIKELEDNKTIVINLLDSLEKNTSYSLLSVYWADWTIDFKINDLINGLEILWDWTTWVDKVNIINWNTIKISFTKDIIWEDIDVKILKEFSLGWLKVNQDNTKILYVKAIDKLDTDSNYIIMLFSFTTKNWNIYYINNSIYDFSTKSELKEVIINNKENIKEENNIWNIALNSAKTPDTGTETWVLLLATFLLSNFIYFRKRFSKEII